MCLHDDIYMCWDEILHQASESACAYYNSNYDSFPDEYVDFLRSYFIAQIDAFEFWDKVTLMTPVSVYTKELFYNTAANWHMRHTVSGLDDVDDEDGGSVRPGVGLHHAAGEGGDPGEPLREGNLLLFHSTVKNIQASVVQANSLSFW